LNRDLSGITPAAIQDADAAMKAAALRYALQDGWRVFPLEPGGKRPLAKLAPHGVLDATTDPAKIVAWWEHEPNANVGIATGSGLIVLDVDGQDGEHALAELEAIDGKLPATLEARTGKGRHLYLAADGLDIRNSASKVGRHLDVRGEGGYVVAPPSLHENGSRYAFRDAGKPASRLPQRWADRITAPPRPAADPGEPVELPDRIPEGGRNDALTRLAGYLQRKGLDPEAIEAALMVENGKRCHPPLTAREVEAIVKSVARYDPADPYLATAAPSSPLASRVSVLDLAELLSVEPDPPAWVWHGYLERGTVGLLHGDGGLGKSLIALGLAKAVTIGGAFLGRPTRPGNALILDAENPGREIHRRLSSFAFGPDERRLSYARVDESILGYPGSTEELLHGLIVELDASLVILDSLRGLWAGDEREAQEVRATFTALRRVAEACGCAFLVLHHDRKAGDYSGSSDVNAVLDSRLHLHRPALKPREEPKPDDRRRVLSHPKMRSAPELPAVPFEVRMVDGIFELELADGAPRHEPEPDERLEKLGDLVRWNRSMSPGALASALGIHVRTLQRMTAGTLASVGVIHDLEGRRYVDAELARCHLCGMDALAGIEELSTPATCRGCREPSPAPDALENIID
jgi:hypothetical protein